MLVLPGKALSCHGNASHGTVSGSGPGQRGRIRPRHDPGSVTEIVGIVPAAGYATRLQPLDCSKEMLSVHGRPVMDHLVERMRTGGCTRLRVVTRPEKRDVVAHARSLDAEVVHSRPATVSQSFAAGMAGLSPDDVVLVGFPDTIWSPMDGYRRLVRAVLDGYDVALGLFRIRPSDLERSDVVTVDPEGRVIRVDVKPAAPSSDVIWGCAAGRVAVLASIDRSKWPGGYFDLLCREGHDIRGLFFSEDWLDIGTKEALGEVTP